MKPRTSFLDAGDAESFDQPNRLLPRRVVESQRTPEDRTKKAEAQLADLIRDQVGASSRRISQQNWQECICVSVNEGDGMSWSAEVVARVFGSRFPNFQLLRLSSRLPGSSLPAISQIVPRRKFLKLVARSGLTSSFLGLGPWQRTGLIVASLAVALAIRVVDLATKPFEHLAGHMDALLASPAFLGLGSAAVVLAFLTERVLTHLLTRESSDAVAKVRDEIEKRGESADFDQLVEELVAAMRQGPRPRAVVIDDFGGLDHTTRRVLLRHFEADGDRVVGGNYWVIFEGEDGERFSPYTYHARELTGFRQARLFHQLQLNPQEKAQLAALLGQPERADFSTVKAICTLLPERLDHYHEFLRDYLATHPRRPNHYGDVDLLFLLALATELGSRPYERGELVGKLAGGRDSVRGRVLAKFLPGTALGLDEFRSRLLRLETDLGRLLTADAASGVTRYAVRPEVKLTLEQHASDLGLQPAGLGHLFWAILWFEKVSSKPVEAFWIRAIALHLKRADLSGLEADDLYTLAEETVFRALLFTVNGALKTCVFEPVVDLLDRALTLSASPTLKGSRNQLRELRRLCWRAYSVLAEEAILALLLRLERPGEHGGKQEPDERELLFQILFVQSLELPQQRRQHAESSFLGAVGDSDDLDSIRVYSGTRSALFVLTALRADNMAWVPPRWNRRDCEGYLSRVLPRYTEGLRNQPRESRGPTDLIAMAVGLDSLVTLLLRQAEESPSSVLLSVLAADAAQESSAAAEPDASAAGLMERPAAAEPAAAGGCCFAMLLDIAEDAVLLAGEHLAPTGLGAASDFVLTGLARELAVVAFSAVVSGFVVLRRLGFESAPTSWLRRSQDIVELAGAVVERLPGVTSFAELTAEPVIAAADRALELSAFVWRRFDLSSLAGLMQSRRLLFNHHCREWRSRDASRFSPLLDALSDTLARRDFLGIYAHLIVADLFADASQLHAYYWVMAAQTVLDGFYHQELKRDFSWFAVSAAHHLDFDLSPFIKFLLEEEDGASRPRLRMIIDQIEDSHLESVLLVLLNASRRSDTAAAVRSALRSGVADPRRRPEAANLMTGMLDLESLRQRVANGESVAAGEVLAAWHARRDHWPYASVLSELVVADPGSDAVIKEGMAILAEHPPPATNTSYLSLATRLTSLLMSRNSALSAAKLPVSYLKVGIRHWESHLRADVNENVYRILYQIDLEDRPLLERKVVEWSAIKLQADDVARLARLRNENQYFALFRYYFSFLRGWGMPVDRPAELDQRLRGSEQQRREEVERWRNAGSSVPPPLVGGRTVEVSTSFLVLGEWLFGKAGGSDGEAQADRRRFNETAAGAIQKLLQLSSSLELPRSIAELLRTHSQRFEHYSSLDDDA